MSILPNLSTLPRGYENNIPEGYKNSISYLHELMDSYEVITVKMIKGEETVIIYAKNPENKEGNFRVSNNEKVETRSLAELYKDIYEYLKNGFTISFGYTTNFIHHSKLVF